MICIDALTLSATETNHCWWDSRGSLSVHWASNQIVDTMFSWCSGDSLKWHSAAGGRCIHAWHDVHRSDKVLHRNNKWMVILWSAGVWGMGRFPVNLQEKAKNKVIFHFLFIVISQMTQQCIWGMTFPCIGVQSWIRQLLEVRNCMSLYNYICICMQKWHTCMYIHIQIYTYACIYIWILYLHIHICTYIHIQDTVCAWRNARGRVTASRIVHLQSWFLRINLNR